MAWSLLFLQLFLFETKITSEKNVNLNGRWVFLGRFKVGSLSRIINNEVLVESIYKPTKSNEKLFAMKKMAIG